MWIALVLVYLWAGLTVFMASKREWYDMNPGGRLFLFGLSLVAWPLAPILMIIGD
jgi:hypothetical protein